MSHDHLIAEYPATTGPCDHNQLGRHSAHRGLRAVAAGHDRAARAWLVLSAHAAQALADQPTATADQQRIWTAVATQRTHAANQCREVMPR